MKKVLLLIDDLGQGGAERQITYLAKELHNRNIIVRLVKFFPGESSYANYLYENGIIPEINLRGKNRWKRILEIIKLIKVWKPNLTIVYKDGTCIAACLAKLFINFRLAVSERNTTQRLSTRERLKFNIFRTADYIIPNSFSQTSFIKKNFSFLSHKIVTIINTIDTEYFLPSQTNICQKRVIIAARLTPQKNVLLFLDALHLAKLNSDYVHFDWFGKIHSIQYYEDIQKKVKSLGLTNLITFHKEGCENIQEEYQRSTHLCLPSIYEGFPNVLCEGMSSGLVCCASNICDNPIILNNERFLFNPKDPADMASKIRAALALPKEEIKTLKSENRKKIIELCSADNFIRQYLKLLK